MNLENLEKNKEILYRKGFGTDLNAVLEEHFKSDATHFTLERTVKVKEDDLKYLLHYRRDDDPLKDQVYLNTISLNLTIGETGEFRTHNFPADKLITAGEAYRMLLHGKSVSVNKNLINKEGDKYNTWINIDVNGAKNEYGNYPVQTYHQNYYLKRPFDLMDKLKNMPLPVKELESETYRTNIEKDLRKAQLIEVTVLYEDKIQKGFLSVNPEIGEVDILDAGMNLISHQEKTQEVAVVKIETPANTNGDQKKNSWGNQKVTWPQKNSNQGKGKRYG